MSTVLLGGRGQTEIGWLGIAEMHYKWMANFIMNLPRAQGLG